MSKYHDIVNRKLRERGLHRYVTVKEKMARKKKVLSYGNRITTSVRNVNTASTLYKDIQKREAERINQEMIERYLPVCLLILGLRTGI